MPTDWAARLDERGYHDISVSRPNTEAVFDSDTYEVEDVDGVWTESDAIVVFDPENQDTKRRLTRGDVVYLRGRAKGAWAEIARIEKFYLGKGNKKKDHGIWFFCTYFWRPEMIRLDDDTQWEKRELFLETKQARSPNSVACIELTPVIVKENAADFVDAPHTFFMSARKYDLAKAELVPPPVDPAAAATAAAGGASADAADAAADPQPMEEDPAAAADAESGAKKPKGARKNAAAANAERDGRIAELEAKVALLEAKVARMDQLEASMRSLEAKFEILSAAE